MRGVEYAQPTKIHDIVRNMNANVVKWRTIKKQIYRQMDRQTYTQVDGTAKNSEARQFMGRLASHGPIS